MLGKRAVIKVGDIVRVKNWTHVAQRLLVLAIHDGYVWTRMDAPGQPGRFSGTHYTFPVAEVERAQATKPSLKRLKEKMVAAHPDRGGSAAAFIAARAAYEEAGGVVGAPDRSKP
jgi:hypothetical protein